MENECEICYRLISEDCTKCEGCEAEAAGLEWDWFADCTEFECDTCGTTSAGEVCQACKWLDMVRGK